MKSNPDVKSKQMAPKQAKSKVNKQNFQNKAGKPIPKPSPIPDPKTLKSHEETDALNNGKGERSTKKEHKAKKRKMNGSLIDSKLPTKKKKVKEPAEKKPTE